MTNDLVKTRRRYSGKLKAQIVAECDLPGASVAKVAMSHGINANIVHGWRKRTREGAARAGPKQLEFVPVTMPAVAEQPAAGRDVEIELRRGAVLMKITWPVSAAADLAAWTRELLR